MIPNELKGKEALPFIHVVSQLLHYLHESHNTERFVELLKEFEDFYSQPFTANMLVNPIGTSPRLPKANDPRMEKYPDEYYKESLEEWQQAEQNRLFEGWELEQGDYTKKNSNGVIEGLIYFSGTDMFLKIYSELSFNEDGIICYKAVLYKSRILDIPKTLNDFITLCTLAGIKLQWRSKKMKEKNTNYLAKNGKKR